MRIWIMIEKIKQCTSFSEVGRILGYDYYNGRLKGIIVKKCNELGIDIETQINEFKQRKVYCIECGGEITGRARFGKKFCSSSCAATHNNKLRGGKSEEERKKISHSLLLHYGRSEEDIKNRDETLIGKHLSKVYKKECPICHQIFWGKKHQTYCSIQCVHKSPDVNEKLRQKQLEKVANGTHSGWQSRDKISYPESFWCKVLDNNNIQYIREDFSTKKYFLDFLIEKDGVKIDLEIDGGQHKRRVDHDKERDEYLTKKGFVVYRIPWKNINNEKGKQYMKNEIDKFLKYYEEC